MKKTVYCNETPFSTVFKQGVMMQVKQLIKGRY